MEQGFNLICWDYCVKMAMIAAGYDADVMRLYREVKGTDYSSPGEPASFDELRLAIHYACRDAGVRPEWYGEDGAIHDLVTFDHVLRQMQWLVICGVNEGILEPGQSYGHFVIARGIQGSEVAIVDSFRHWDGNRESYGLKQFHEALRHNWEHVHGCRALAFRTVPM